MGAEIKNTVALGFGDRVVLSPHVGDLETPEALDGLETVARRLPEFLGRAPDAVAVDLNPDMHASRLGRALAGEFAVPVVEVQHHRAHAEACLAEHGRDAGLALVFDGNGLGTDGTAWGAELIEIRPDGWRRLAGFAPVPLPGGDAAVREPARQLVARWVRAGVPISDEGCRRLGVEPEAAATWARQCVDGLNAPLSSGAGRVFDAFSAALGFAPRAITYEGQAAIRLETAARRHGDGPAPALPFLTREEHDFFLVDWAPAFARLSDWGAVSKEPGAWAAAAHRAVADAAAAMVSYGFDASACRAVALSGGCFMNRVLSSLLTAKLDAMGAETLVHRETPPNDGCIALGQALVAGTCGGAA